MKSSKRSVCLMEINTDGNAGPKLWCTVCSYDTDVENMREAQSLQVLRTVFRTLVLPTQKLQEPSMSIPAGP